MKTPAEYVNAQVSSPEVPATVPYVAAVAAVAQALADAARYKDLLSQALRSFRDATPDEQPQTVMLGTVPLPFKVLPYTAAEFPESPPF